MSQRTVVTIGNFDGVHLGHRAILAQAVELAQHHNATVTALTFDPHPATVLRPGCEPPRLTHRDEKVALLSAAGAQRVETLTPTAALLSLSPRQFIEQLIAQHLPVAMVEGADFRFGKDRAGDVATLRALGEAMGFDARIIAPVEVALSDHLIAPVRSSLVRWLLSQGRVMDAAICLGRPYSLTANVVAGDRRGRTLGVPTANLDPAACADRCLPADGVYAALVELPKALGDTTGQPTRPAAVSIGVKPTFQSARRTIEAHLLDFQGDLYDQPITLRFGRWLRDQQPFPSRDALRDQLLRDIAAVRRLHAGDLITNLPRVLRRSAAHATPQSA